MAVDSPRCQLTIYKTPQELERFIEGYHDIIVKIPEILDEWGEIFEFPVCVPTRPIRADRNLEDLMLRRKKNYEKRKLQRERSQEADQCEIIEVTEKSSHSQKINFREVRSEEQKKKMPETQVVSNDSIFQEINVNHKYKLNKKSTKSVKPRSQTPSKSMRNLPPKSPFPIKANKLSKQSLIITHSPLNTLRLPEKEFRLPEKEFKLLDREFKSPTKLNSSKFEKQFYPTVDPLFDPLKLLDLPSKSHRKTRKLPDKQLPSFTPSCKGSVMANKFPSNTPENQPPGSVSKLVSGPFSSAYKIPKKPRERPLPPLPLPSPSTINRGVKKVDLRKVEALNENIPDIDDINIDDINNFVDIYGDDSTDIYPDITNGNESFEWSDLSRDLSLETDDEIEQEMSSSNCNYVDALDELYDESDSSDDDVSFKRRKKRP